MIMAQIQFQFLWSPLGGLLTQFSWFWEVRLFLAWSYLEWIFTVFDDETSFCFVFCVSVILIKFYWYIWVISVLSFQFFFALPVKWLTCRQLQYFTFIFLVSLRRSFHTLFSLPPRLGTLTLPFMCGVLNLVLLLLLLLLQIMRGWSIHAATVHTAPPPRYSNARAPPPPYLYL